MAASPKFFCTILIFLCICAKGKGKSCEVWSIKIDQHISGSDPTDFEFEVVVKNNCSCAQKGVRIKAEGFFTIKAVDPKLFRPDGDAYLINDGRPILSCSNLTFSYWGNHAAYFSPLNAQPVC